MKDIAGQFLSVRHLVALSILAGCAGRDQDLSTNLPAQAGGLLGIVKAQDVGQAILVHEAPIEPSHRLLIEKRNRQLPSLLDLKPPRRAPDKLRNPVQRNRITPLEIDEVDFRGGPVLPAPRLSGQMAVRPVGRPARRPG